MSKKNKSLAEQYPDHKFTPVVKLYTRHKRQKLLIFSDGSCVFEFRKEPLWAVIDKGQLMKLIVNALPKDIKKFV